MSDLIRRLFGSGMHLRLNVRLHRLLLLYMMLCDIFNLQDGDVNLKWLCAQIFYQGAEIVFLIFLKRLFFPCCEQPWTFLFRNIIIWEVLEFKWCALARFLRNYGLVQLLAVHRLLKAALNYRFAR